MTYIGTQCNAGIYSIHESVLPQLQADDQALQPEQIDQVNQNDGRVTLYRNPAAHNHEELLNKAIKIPTAMKEEIDKQIGLGIKTPKEIAFALRANDDPNAPQPSYIQIKNTKAVYKREQQMEGPITMRELQSFVDQHKAVPDGIDKAYIAGFDRPASTDPRRYFSFFVTTLRRG